MIEHTRGGRIYFEGQFFPMEIPHTVLSQIESWIFGEGGEGRGPHISYADISRGENFAYFG